MISAAPIDVPSGPVVIRCPSCAALRATLVMCERVVAAYYGAALSEHHLRERMILDLVRAVAELHAKPALGTECSCGQEAARHWN